MTIGGSDNAGYQEFLDGRTLNNSGAATLAVNPNYGGALYFLDGATFNNKAGASFSFITDASILDEYGTPDGGTFINHGTFAKTSSIGTSVVGITFDALGGSVDVETGTISLNGGGELGSTFSLTGTLSLDSDNYTLDNGLSVSGSGTMGLTGATATVTGNATLSNLTQSGGTLTGAGTLTVSGLTTWTGGYESGAGSTNANGGLTIGGSDNAAYQEFLDGRMLNNQGAATLAVNPSEGGALYFLDGATFNNKAGASFSFITDASIVDNYGIPDGGTFINHGTFAKTGSAGTSGVGITFDALGGSVDVETGAISLTAGGEVGSTFSLTGALSLDAGNFTLDNGLSVSGSGAMGLTGATATVTGNATLPNFTQSGGTLTGAGTLTVSGLTTWTGGHESGAGITNANGGLTIGDSDNAAYQEFLDGRTLNNRGAATLAVNPSEGGALYFLDGATFNNMAGASFSFITDVSIVDNYGTPDGGTFINAGTLAKTGGTGTSALDSGVTLNNTGTIEVDSGTLSLRGGGTISGSSTLTAYSGADLDFGYGSYTAPSGSSIGGSGTGTISFTGATVAINGTYSVAEVTSISAGEVDFNSSASTGTLIQAAGTIGGTGILTVAGLTTWTGGVELGAGITNANGGLTIGGSDNAAYQEFLDGRTLNNAGAATLAFNPNDGGALYFLDGATFNNKTGASFTFITDASISDQYGTPDGGTFINHGTFAKTGGTGTSGVGITFDALGGSVNVETGTISLTAGGELGSTFSLTGALSLDSGNFTLDNGLSVSGSGTMGLTGYTDTTTATVAGNATLPNFTQTGGVLTGTGTLTVSGLTTWTGGSESGAGITDANGGLTIGGSDNAGYQEFLDGRTLNNAGRSHPGGQSKRGRRTLLPGRRHLQQQGRSHFSFITDASISDDSGTPDGGTFINHGTFAKTGGAGTSGVGITFDALGGSVNVETGTISLTAGGELGSTFSLTGT